MVRCALLVAMGLPLTAKSFATAPLELAPPPIAAGRRVSVWWKPHSATGLEAEVGSIVSDLAATDVLVYCGYAALPNGSFGVSPNATQQTWGNVTLCEAAVRQAAAAGLHARIMVEGRATLGFEAAVARGGARFGAEIAAIFGPKPFGSGLQGFKVPTPSPTASMRSSGSACGASACSSSHTVGCQQSSPPRWQRLGQRRCTRLPADESDAGATGRLHMHFHRR
jgi:hypothetical protein